VSAAEKIVRALLVEVTVPIRTVSEANSRNHWAKKARRVKEQRQMVASILGTQNLGFNPRDLAPCGGARVVLTRIAPRELDSDNLASALKATRDEVAKWLGIDDRDARLTWEVAQERGLPKEYAVRIEVLS
jgi:hypothetical protein